MFVYTPSEIRNVRKTLFPKNHVFIISKRNLSNHTKPFCWYIPALRVMFNHVITDPIMYCIQNQNGVGGGLWQNRSNAINYGCVVDIVQSVVQRYWQKYLDIKCGLLLMHSKQEHVDKKSLTGTANNVYALIPLHTLIARLMGPTWDPSGADRTQVGPMLAPWTLLSG